MLEKKIWNIISPYDFPDLSPDFEVRLKSSRSKSIFAPKSHTQIPSQPKPRKSFPKKIEDNSHILLPTKSSQLKSMKKTTKGSLVKSKSSTNLRDNFKNNPIRKSVKETKDSNQDPFEAFEIIRNIGSKSQRHSDAARIDKAERDFEDKLKKCEDKKNTDQPVKKNSNPKNLEIDIEYIENQYSSPIHYNPLPIEIVRVDTLNFYSTPFTMTEAISSDLLTGKIYVSSQNIRDFMLIKPAQMPSKRLISHPQEFIEISLPDETSNEVENASVSVSPSQQSCVLTELKSLLRHPRSLADVSQRVGEVIEKMRFNYENSLQCLIGKTLDVPRLALQFPAQYPQSQDFLVDLFICLWGQRIKPLTAQSISVYLESDRMISELPKQKDPGLKLQFILGLIPLLIVTWRLSEASEYINQSLLINSHSGLALIWKAWLEILTNKSTSASYYALSQIEAPANMSMQYKISLVYTFYYSCVFRSTNRTVAFAKTQNLGDWENIVIADVYTRSSDKSFEDEAVGMLKQLLESSNKCIKFLACYRLFKVYKDYNQYSKALEIANRAKGFELSENFKVFIEICRLKATALLNGELSLASEAPLAKYEYSRLSLKYNISCPLNKVLQYINESCSYAQLYSISTCQFSVNFWKFILYKKLGVHKLAAKQAISTLDYEPIDKAKQLAISEYLKSIDSMKYYLEKLAFAAITKDNIAKMKIIAQISDFDEYLSNCIASILMKSIQNKEKLPIHKYEGYFAVWTMLYANSKHKEKQFKSLDGQEEIDKRDKKHPLYILSKIKKDWKEVTWLNENSICLQPGLLWNLFGKQIGKLSLKDSYRIMQAKSYLRTSVPRSLHKLEKGSKSSINNYYQAKLQISMIKFQKSASDANFQKIFSLLKEFHISDGISSEYQVKVLYNQAELAFMTKNYQYCLNSLSYNYLNEAEAYSSMIGSKYLTKSKRALNIDLVKQRLNM